ncbi:MAG: TIGR02453 family protein, partial [Rubripirellula sp.]
DKTPYKTNIGISVRHQADKNIHAPGVYLHLEPDECFIGAGSWRPASAQLAAFRAAIADDPKGWIKARDQKGYREHYSLSGESLKTSPRDYDKDHPMIEDLRRIDFIGISPFDEADMTGPDVVAKVIGRIKKAKPMMSFLCDAIGVPY